MTTVLLYWPSVRVAVTTPAATPTATPTTASTATATPRPSPSAVPSPVAAGGAKTTIANCLLPPLPGAFLGLDDRALYGPQGASDQAQIILFPPGRPARVLVKGLPPFSVGGIAASPDGRLVAFGRDQDRSPGNRDRPDNQGLWVMQRDGSNPRRLLQVPPSPIGNFLAIGPLAWSSDGKTLAYSVQPLGSGTACSDPMAGGVWLSTVDYPQPRRLATAVQLGTLQPPPPASMGCPSAVSRLSWSPDGKVLVVSSARPKPNTGRPGDIEPVVLAVDAGSGAAQALVVGGTDAVFAPTADRLAYLTSVAPTGGTPAQFTLSVADAQGKQARKLLTQEALIHQSVWSPDGRFLAFVGNAAGLRQGWTLQVVDAGQGTLCTVMTAAQLQQSPFLAGGSLDSLAWAPDAS